MSKSSQTGALILMLLLLIPCSIGAFLGFMNKGTSTQSTNDNPEHLQYYDNKLWFYSLAGQPKGTYDCETQNCKVASSTSNDTEYPHMDPNVYTKELPLINDHFVFIQDSAEQTNAPIFLYDTSSRFAYKDNPYVSIKKYTALDNYYIVENANKQFGILRVESMAQLVVQFENDYIGVLDNDSHNIVLKQGNKWFIMDSSLNKMGNQFEQTIIGASKDYVAVKDGDISYVINYDGLKILPDDYQDVFLIDKYAGVITEDSEFIVYDLSTKGELGDAISINASDKVSMKKENSELIIEINGQKGSSIKI